jgi:hypothetical protein
VAATAEADEITWASHIAVLEDDHPLRRWVCEAIFAAAVEDGDIPGPYSQRRAEAWAREALLPAGAFLLRAHEETDAQLAERFAVPIEPVRQRRTELCPTG